MRGKRVLFGAVLLEGLTALAFVGCEPQVLRLLPGDGVDAGLPGSAVGPSRRTSCKRDADCEQPLPQCDVAKGRCVECTSSSDCESSEACDPGTERCTIPCNHDDDCRRGSDYCDTRRGFCVQCFSDPDCTTHDQPFCDPGSGRCVECLTAANCSTTSAICDPYLHYCDSCALASKCVDAGSCASQRRTCAPAN